MTERTIMTEKTRLRPGELTAPKTNFATIACITGDENNGNNMRKIEQPHDATAASLDEHFPGARRVGLEVRHSSDAPTMIVCR